MPSGVMDQRRFLSFGLPAASSSFFQEEIHLPTQRQVGFWKADVMHKHREADGMPVSSSPLESLSTTKDNTLESLDLPHHPVFKEQSLRRSFRHQPVGAERNARTLASIEASDVNFGHRINKHAKQLLSFVDEKEVVMNGMSQETGLFSSSLSEIFDTKLRMSSDKTFFSKCFSSKLVENEPSKLLKEIDVQTLGSLLPDDDDLLSGINEETDRAFPSKNVDDIDDDLFRSIGGLELEVDDNVNGSLKNEINVDNDGQRRLWGGPYGTEHPFGERPARTLFVRNINSNVDDAELRSLFEQYGEIRGLYTACKHRGFVMISFYDIRSAVNAMRGLQSKPLQFRNIDIHFSIPKDNPSEEEVNHGVVVLSNVDSALSNDDIRRIFCTYGEIKEIRESPHKLNHKFVEFYDVRAAEEARRSLNEGDIAESGIKLDTGHTFDTRCLLQISSQGDRMDKSAQFSQSPPNNSTMGGINNPMKFGTISHGSLDDKSIRGFPPVSAPFSMFSDTQLHGISNNIHHGMHPRFWSVNNRSDQDEGGHFMKNPNFAVQQHQQTFRPHSLPEYHNGIINGFPSPASTAALSTMSQNLDSRTAADGYGDGRMSSVSCCLNAHSDGGIGSCPFNGRQQFAWNNRSSQSIWPNSPFVNGVSPHSTLMHGCLLRPSSHIMNAILPLNPHHMGSAPTVNSPLWERPTSYSGSPAGSLGSLGFSGNTPMPQLDAASHNMFPHMGSPSFPLRGGIPSPQQRCHFLHGRNPMGGPVLPAYDAPGERFRSRRSDSISSQADIKKQYELDIERIVRGEDSRTTLMIKNIPNKYTSKMLLAAIDEHHRGTYDFIYLPIDFKNKCNVGYAFINMVDSQHIIPFYQTFNGKKWEKFNSEKVASLAYARIQGKSALIAHFQNSSLMNEDKRCRPILFHSDGPNAGDQEPFPICVNRSRSGRARAASNEENSHGGSPSVSPKRDGSPVPLDPSTTTTRPVNFKELSI